MDANASRNARRTAAATNGRHADAAEITVWPIVTRVCAPSAISSPIPARIATRTSNEVTSARRTGVMAADHRILRTVSWLTSRTLPFTLLKSMPHKLLLADDSVTIQRVIELTFADEDVQVIAVGNGQQAIERAERDRPDIVLADVGMPERDGYEVAAFIKGNPTLSHIPVVLLTGAFEPIDESRARAVGCDGVLVEAVRAADGHQPRQRTAGRTPAAGLWGGGPAAQGPVRVPGRASSISVRRRPRPTSGDPLEAYFDRLDAAFSAKGATPSRGSGLRADPGRTAGAETRGDSALEGHIVDRGR